MAYKILYKKHALIILLSVVSLSGMQTTPEYPLIKKRQSIPLLGDNYETVKHISESLIKERISNRTAAMYSYAMQGPMLWALLYVIPKYFFDVVPDHEEYGIALLTAFTFGTLYVAQQKYCKKNIAQKIQKAVTECWEKRTKDTFSHFDVDTLTDTLIRYVTYHGSLETEFEKNIQQQYFYNLRFYSGIVKEAQHHKEIEQNDQENHSITIDE